MTSLMAAAYKGYVSAVQDLLQHPDVEVDAADTSMGTTALMYAAMEGHTDIVNVLMKAQADIHALDKFSRTPLHLASSKGQVETLVALVNSGA